MYVDITHMKLYSVTWLSILSMVIQFCVSHTYCDLELEARSFTDLFFWYDDLML